METLGELIKRTLKEKGIKESYVAGKMNVSKQVINQIDRRKNFDLVFLNELKEVTGIDFTKYLPTHRTSYPTAELVSDAFAENEPAYNSIDIVGRYQLTFGITNKGMENFKKFNDEIVAISNKYEIKIL